MRILQALRQVIRAIDLHSRQLFLQHKITGPQLISLLAIEEQGDITASTLANRVHLSPSTVIGILDRLEARGWVRRRRDMRDRRLVHISLTEAGQALAQNAPSPLQTTLAEAIARLPEGESARIAEALERVVALMQMQHVEAAPILTTGPIHPLPDSVES